MSPENDGDMENSTLDIEKLLRMSASKDIIEASEEPVPSDVEKSVKMESINYDREQKKAALKDYLQDIKLRKTFAWAGYYMNIGWLVAILVIIFLSGFHRWNFSLPESVLLALIGTTTTNVLGVLFIVMRYLFHKKP